MGMQDQGRSFGIGRYVVTISGGGITIFGPDAGRTQEARLRMGTLLATVEGCTLLGRLLNGRTLDERESAKNELAVNLGLPQPVTHHVEPESTASIAGKPVDYDDNHAQIVAFRLPDMCTRTITELHGICEAVVADSILTAAEIVLVRDWLSAIRPEFRQAWPISDLADKMTRILADGKVTPAEQADLLAFLSSIAADPNKVGLVDQSLCDKDPNIVFKGKLFLFTGRLRACKRAAAWAAVKERGGEITNYAEDDVDYLVIGELGNEAYQYSRYGRKVEEMKELRQVGHKVVFVAESDFVKALVSSPATPVERKE